MHTNSNIETRSQIKRKFCRFAKTAHVLDLRDSREVRKTQAERYAKRNGTCGKRAVFA